MSSAATTQRIRERATSVRLTGAGFYQLPPHVQDALRGLAGEMDEWADELDRLRGLVDLAATPGKWDDFLDAIGVDNGR